MARDRRRAAGPPGGAGDHRARTPVARGRPGHRRPRRVGRRAPDGGGPVLRTRRQVPHAPTAGGVGTGRHGPRPRADRRSAGAVDACTTPGHHHPDRAPGGRGTGRRWDHGRRPVLPGQRGRRHRRRRRRDHGHATGGGRLLQPARPAHRRDPAARDPGQAGPRGRARRSPEPGGVGERHGRTPAPARRSAAHGRGHQGGRGRTRFPLGRVPRRGRGRRLRGHTAGGGPGRGAAHAGAAPPGRR